MNAQLRLNQFVQRGSTNLVDLATRIPAVRQMLIRRAEQRLHENFVEKNPERVPEEAQELRVRALSNLLQTLDTRMREGVINPHLRRRLIETFVGNVLEGEQDRMKPFRDAYGFDPPTFLTISPTKKCNLRCTGCYAASDAKMDNTLDYDVFTRLLREKQEEWGSNFTVISGGEPLLYRSQGKNLLDVIEEFPNSFFMMYTNATLIDDAVARRMAELGNITPAISVEGWEQETDERRGKGIFNRVLKAMRHLREHGVPFGMSVTATKYNAETISSDEFVNYFFDEQKITYAWVFQYMPIGRSYSMDLLVSPNQRQLMLNRQLTQLREHGRFLVDFWNGGPISMGCIAGGRSGGYFYVDWDGNISPCVFFPYGIANLHDLYDNGHTISHVLLTDYFRKIREWQDRYTGNRGQGDVGNLFMPCPIRDHHQFARDLINEHGAKPLDEDAEAALEDPEYHEAMNDYDRRLHERLDPEWQKLVERNR
jgi:MoaA/NifB/PqqE/SkfB family radical SAM enzyme